MNEIGAKSNFYNQFSKIDLSSNKEYLKNAYTNFVQKEEGDSFSTKKPKNSKKKKVIAASFIAASALAVGTLLVKGLSHRGNFDINKFTKNSKTFGSKAANVMSNTINIKDDIWDKFLKKTEHTPLFFAKKIGDGITNVYLKTLSASLGPKYKKAVEALKKAGYKGEIPDFETWFEKTNKNMYEALHKKGERVTDNLFNKDIINKVTSSNIADGKLQDIISGEFIKTQNESADLIKAAKDFNNIKGTLIAKMRDINCGSAPTDLLTIILSSLGLGAAAINADTKEERKSIFVNLGIPLSVTLASTTYGTMKALSGPKSLIFGLITGQMATLSAKFIDKFIIKKNQIKNAPNQ